MRTAIIINGIVTDIIVLPDGAVISSDLTTASSATTYQVQPFGGAPQTVAYTAVSTAPAGGVFVPTDTAGIGDSWTSSGGFVSAVVPPPSKDELIQYATTKQLSVVVGGITLTGTPTAAALATVTSSINAGSVATFAQVDTALTPAS